MAWQQHRALLAACRRLRQPPPTASPAALAASPAAPHLHVSQAAAQALERLQLGAHVAGEGAEGGVLDVAQQMLYAFGPKQRDRHRRREKARGAQVCWWPSDERAVSCMHARGERACTAQPRAGASTRCVPISSASVCPTSVGMVMNTWRLFSVPSCAAATVAGAAEAQRQQQVRRSKLGQALRRQRDAAAVAACGCCLCSLQPLLVRLPPPPHLPHFVDGGVCSEGQPDLLGLRRRRSCVVTGGDGGRRGGSSGSSLGVSAALRAARASSSADSALPRPLACLLPPPCSKPCATVENTTRCAGVSAQRRSPRPRR